MRDTAGDIDGNAAAALRETSRRLDAVLDNTRMGVFVMDERQHCVYANAAAEQLTGYTFAEMQGRPLHDVIHHKHPDGRHYPLEDCPIDRAFPEDFQVEGEEVFVHKDGSFYPVAFTASPIRDEASQTVGTVIEVRGIADRKAREAALRESEARYRTLFDSIDQGFCVIEVLFDGERAVDYRFLEVNAAFVEQTGLQDAAGKTMRSLRPGHEEHWFEIYGRVALTGETARFEHEAAALGRWYDVYAYRVSEPARHRVAILFKDVTENRRIQDALTAERDRLYGLFENAPGLVAAVHGPDHVFVLANEAYRELVGRDVIGKPLREALPELEGQGLYELLENVYASGEPFVGVAVPGRLKRTPDSEPEERFYDFVYQPIREADGTVSGIFHQGFDVTERVLFMSQQKMLLDELNHRVKNNLATVQSIAYQTARHAPDLATFRKTFDSRLIALSRTHDVLTAGSWESADLRAVLEAELGPYGENRVRLEGPAIRLNPQQGLALGLVIHELATNAAKYGALSHADGGCVRVTWSDGDARLRLFWNESEGPPVTPPERRGFGSRLIERGVQELGGEVVKQWKPEGLDCRIEIPL